MPIETPLDALVIEPCKKIHEKKWVGVRNYDKGIATHIVECHVEKCIFARRGLNLLCAHPDFFKDYGFHGVVVNCLSKLSSEKQRHEIGEDYMQLTHCAGLIDRLQRLSYGGYISKGNPAKEARYRLSISDPLFLIIKMMEEYVDTMLVGGLTYKERPWPSPMYPVSDKKRAEFDMLIETAEGIIAYRMSEVIKRLRFQYLITLASV